MNEDKEKEIREEFYNQNGIFFDLDSNIELANRVYTLAVKQEREKVRQEVIESLKQICNKSKTERGLAKAIGNLIKNLSNK